VTSTLNRAVPRILEQGEPIAPGYTVIDLISRGSALDVYEVFSHDRMCSCIAKTIRPDRAQVERVRDRLLLEGHLLTILAHPHLPRAFETIAEPVPVVVIETIVGLNLEEIIDSRQRRLPSADLAHLGRQLSSAVHYLHGHGYLHLDIRPANVMAHAGIARLIDLSVARPAGVVPRGFGTRDYMAPEQAVGGRVTAATDAWGIGVTLYEAATAISAFAPLDESELESWDAGTCFQLIRRAPPLHATGRRLHAGLAAVIDDCLHPAAVDRPAIDDVHGRLGDVLADLGQGDVEGALTP
jgi:serine/threonine protein kinase